MGNNKVKYGAATGLACGVWIIGAHFSGLDSHMSRFIILACMAIIFAGIFFTIYKEKQSLGGEIEFKEALKTGLSAGVLSAILFSVFIYIYYTFLSPNFADPILLEIAEKYKAAGKSSSEIETEMINWRKDFTATSQTGKTLLVTMFLSLFFAALNALILCKKN